MRSKCSAPRPRALRPLVVLGCSLAVLLALVGCRQATNRVGDGTVPMSTLTSKQAALATTAAGATAISNTPYPQKHPVSVTPITSCPMPTPQPGIFAPSLPTQGYPNAVVDNSIAVMPADQPLYDYAILAGN